MYQSMNSLVFCFLLQITILKLVETVLHQIPVLKDILSSLSLYFNSQNNKNHFRSRHLFKKRIGGFTEPRVAILNVLVLGDQNL